MNIYYLVSWILIPFLFDSGSTYSYCCHFCNWRFKEIIQCKVEATGSYISFQWFCVTSIGKWIKIEYLYFFRKNYLPIFFVNLYCTLAHYAFCCFACRRIVILMLNPWSCFWVNTQLGKPLSLSTYWSAAIQVSHIFICFLSFTYNKVLNIPILSEFLFYKTGAHIGPEPTTDRFIVVTVKNYFKIAHLRTEYCCVC